MDPGTDYHGPHERIGHAVTRDLVRDQFAGIVGFNANLGNLQEPIFSMRISQTLKMGRGSFPTDD